MARKKSPLAIQVEYQSIRGLLKLFQTLPFSASKALCGRLLQLLLFVLSKRRRLVEANLRACFPGRPDTYYAELGERSTAYLARGLASFSRIPLMDAQTMEDTVEIQGFEHLREAFAKGKGAITFTAHYGFWELMAIYVTRIYPKVSMVVRPLDNPMLDRLVMSIRGSGGGGVIDSKRVFKEGIRHLRANGLLGVLIDQNFHKGGVFVDFFGRPAATSTLVPILARRTGCTLLPMHNVWLGDRIRIICEPPVELSSNPDAHRAIEEDTQKLTSIVERWVREDPAQWLWLHNRWKRIPSSSDSQADGSETNAPHRSGLGLQLSGEKKNNQNQDDEPDAATRIVTPSTAVRPGRQSSDERQDENDN